jgi:acid stress-induced BolA-like protein IbaG/YrbA
MMSGIEEAIGSAIRGSIAGAEVAVKGGGGHFEIEVVSERFAGLSTLERHRLVLGAIKHLMEGDAPAVHAVDALRTRTP